MALVDPYSPCPCGSGQKYKWCCQRVEAYIERAQRLLDNGQYEPAIKPLEEGLAKEPENASLLLRKAVVHIHLGQLEQARASLRSLLMKHPGHLAGSILVTRVVLDSEGPSAAVAEFQQALSACQPEHQAQLGSLASFLGSALARHGFIPAALKHLELAASLGGGEDQQSIASLRKNPGLSPWEKNPYRLSPAPENVSEPFRESFERALAWADHGLWSSAASAFELLSAGSGPGVVAERNRGLCCLWLADYPNAVAAFRRSSARIGPTIDAVDLEALCQEIEDAPPFNRVDFVQLTWAIRNRDGLLAALRANPNLHEDSPRPLDPNDPKSPEVLRFAVLDRPAITAKPSLTRHDIPVIEAEVLVGQDAVHLEAYDDGRLDRLSDRFTALAGTNIPPAHPRTKLINREQRHLLDLSWRWQFPAGLTAEEENRLKREQTSYIVSEIWPKTPNPALRRRSPLQAAQAGDSETALRAAVRLLEVTHEIHVDVVDWKELRARLQLKPEPAIDPETADIEQLHLSRLSLIPVDQLDDDRILKLFHRCREYGVRALLTRLERLIDSRPALLAKSGIAPVALYGDLAIQAAQEELRSEAEDWIARGRQADPPEKRSLYQVSWDLVELQVKMVLDEPEVWVPSLAIILERYSGNSEATSAVLLRLVHLGLVQATVDPKRPGQLQLDTRILSEYLTRYGPRITTATGELGAAAAKSEILTPGSAAGTGGGAIWTPGSAPQAPRGAGKPRIIQTGQ
jgi:tetratricopeptide (TPR) repeat protein